MKTLIRYFMIAMMIAIVSCRKKPEAERTVPVAAAPDNYSSIQDFYTQNGVRMQTFNLDATTGGSFTTPQGTKVTIPANAFVTLAGAPVTGNVTIEFKDVYKKSDMLLLQLSTIDIHWNTLKSGGMFFIKASLNINALKLATGKFIKVEQPFVAGTALPDSGMKPFVIVDTVIFNPTPDSLTGWAIRNIDSLKLSTSNYVFSLYRFESPEEFGTWGNSDDPTYFSAFPQTTFNIIPNDIPDTFQTDVFIVFKNENSLVHVYRTYIPPIKFPYNYAPLGLQCTVVAIGVRNGELYSLFTPNIISTNQSLYFTLSKTTTADFKADLKALD